MRWSIPRLILAAFGFDILLGAAFVVDFALGNPIDRISSLLDLDGEANLPAWWASVQWFVVAAFLWVFAVRSIRPGGVRSWFLFLLPIAFTLFSVDEVAKLHESVGSVLDRLVLSVPRIDTELSKTGVWFLLFGVPFAALFILLIAGLRPYLQQSPAAFTRVAVGVAVFFVGAIGIEALSNVVVQGSALDMLQVLVEETFEFIGSTLVLWGSYELARSVDLFRDPD